LIGIWISGIASCASLILIDFARLKQAALSNCSKAYDLKGAVKFFGRLVFYFERQPPYSKGQNTSLFLL
jgi:hypothetical protein